MDNYFRNEPTRKVLINYLEQTEKVFQEALLEYDRSASCKIFPSLDLGFPHDVARIAGGFATGSLITWQCNTPFIPIDTTVNVCSSSLFELDEDISDKIGQSHFEVAIEKLNKSSYMLNYHRGNHFITLMRSMSTGKNYLVLHSSASEFKKTYNGLYPVEGNWFIDDVKIYRNKNRYIRYIVGKKAELFAKIAHQIEVFNRTRQEFIAATVLDNLCEIISVSHHDHYYMPTDQSVMIGSFLLKPYDIAPIFTYPGVPIYLYQAHPSETNTIKLDNDEWLLVPHGWGKTSKTPPVIEIDIENKRFTLNGVDHAIDINSSLRDHPDLTLRQFSIDSSQPDYYFSHTAEYFSGEIVDMLEQIFTYNKTGLTKWSD